MSAAVHILPGADGPGIVYQAALPMRVYMKDLPAFRSYMDRTECGRMMWLTELDTLVGDLSAVLHGYEVAMEQPWANVPREERTLVRQLCNAIANYMQSRANEVSQ